MKTRRLLIPVAAATALVLAACGGGGGEAEADSNQVRFYHDKAQWEEQFGAIADLSLESNDVDLEVVGYADDAAYDSFIRSSFLTDERPDLFTWHTGGPLAELVDEGLVAPSDDIWDEAIEAGDVPADMRSTFEIDGATYCVPLLSDYWVMYYNVEIFDSYGFSPPQTWAEMIEIADTLVADGQTPFNLPGSIFSFTWFQQLMIGMYPDVYDALGTGEASYTDPEVVEVMEYWQEMMAAGYMTEPGIEIGPQEMLRDGVVAMIPIGAWFHGPLSGLELTSGEDFGTFIIPNVDPSLDQTSVVVELGPLCMAANAPNPDQAEEFQRWWMAPEAQSEFTTARSGMSYNPAAGSTDEQLTEISETIAADHRIHTRYLEATPPPVATVAMEQFDAFMADPGDPMPYLELIQQTQEDYWAQ